MMPGTSDWKQVAPAKPRWMHPVSPRARLSNGEGCEENERHVAPLGKQLSLQLDAAHARHLDICNHTREAMEEVRPQELCGGCECSYDVPERPHKAVSRGSHGCIIVNDCD